MTFTTSPADRKDGGGGGGVGGVWGGAIVPKKRCPGQACDLSVLLAMADIWGRWEDAGILLRGRSPVL